MIDRLVVWGGTTGLHSHRWIQSAYAQTARKLGVHVQWLPDSPSARSSITAGDVVLSADVFGQHIGEAVPGARYVLHNFDGSHVLCQTAAPENLLRLQVWTNEAHGESWDVYRQFDRENRILFQPWGCDLLAEEFLDPEFNQASRDIAFVGAIWADQHDGMELGNEGVIQELIEACEEYGLEFKHLTQVTDGENIRAVREARLAPSLVGGWQAGRGYIACRALKNPAYGALMFTNSDAINHLFGDATVGGYTVSEIVSNALALRRFDYLEMVREQQRVVSRYTYRESLQSISRALEEIA